MLLASPLSPQTPMAPLGPLTQALRTGARGWGGASGGLRCPGERKRRPVGALLLHQQPGQRLRRARGPRGLARARSVRSRARRGRPAFGDPHPMESAPEGLAEGPGLLTQLSVRLSVCTFVPSRRTEWVCLLGFPIGLSPGDSGGLYLHIAASLLGGLCLGNPGDLGQLKAPAMPLVVDLPVVVDLPSAGGGPSKQAWTLRPRQSPRPPLGGSGPGVPKRGDLGAETLVASQLFPAVGPGQSLPSIAGLTRHPILHETENRSPAPCPAGHVVSPISRGSVHGGSRLTRRTV